MREFTALYFALDQTTSTLEKREILAEYFARATPEDSAWVVYLLTGRKLKRAVPTKFLRELAQKLLNIPDWLFEESYTAVGDLAETVALLVKQLAPAHSETEAENLPLHEWIEKRILVLQTLDPYAQKELIETWWAKLSGDELFLFNKLITGGFRVGVAQGIVEKALAQVAQVPASIISHRMMGNWSPEKRFFTNLIAKSSDTFSEHADSERATEERESRPYPFFLASALDREFSELGDPSDWQIEWKWDGIRAQLIRRATGVYLWSRGEELITERFPEISESAKKLPVGTVIDGEILAYRNEAPLPFAMLQKRIGKLKVTASLLRDAPVGFMAYDLLEAEGEDLREQPLAERRKKLEALLMLPPRHFHLSSILTGNSWEDFKKQQAQSRAMKVEGLMVKKRDSTYQSGRKRGTWWKWKVDPFTIDAVLLYAQAGHGRRANLFTDYTFALWEGEKLVPFAKAYSGLTDIEISELDAWIRKNTKESFGPVRSLTPSHVFELAFEGISYSPRHRSGVAVRFPRILRWRRDKLVKDADRLETLKSMIETNPEPDLFSALSSKGAQA